MRTRRSLGAAAGGSGWAGEKEPGEKEPGEADEEFVAGVSGSGVATIRVGGGEIVPFWASA
jgi:hypothetical protein